MMYDEAQQIGQTAAQNPGKTALVGLLTSPLALKASGVALRWARRHPVLAIAAVAGAYAFYRRRNSYGAGSFGRSNATDFAAAGAGTPGLNATGETGGGIGSRDSGVGGDADGWSGGYSGGTVRHGTGYAGSGADSSQSIAGASSGTPSARAGL